MALEEMNVVKSAVRCVDETTWQNLDEFTKEHPEVTIVEDSSSKKISGIEFSPKVDSFTYAIVDGKIAFLDFLKKPTDEEETPVMQCYYSQSDLKHFFESIYI